MNTVGKNGFNVTRDTLLIKGHEIRISHEEVEQKRLRFYEANPRIYSLLRQDGGGHPTQEQIEKQLLAMEHVKVLIQDIKQHGGLIEPLIVRDQTYDVLEGNSRLAAYRALARQDPVKWAKIRCTILPHDVDEKLVFALLAQVHIKGKKDWAKYEQAGFLYRRSTEQKIDLHTLSQESSLSLQRVRQLIDIYRFMLDVKENDIKHWSHYEEFLKSRKIARARSRFPDFQDRIVTLIKEDATFRAVDVRDRLPKVCIGPEKNLRRFSEGKIDFETAYEIAIDSGAGNTVLQKINKFRQWLAESHVVDAIKGAEDRELDKLSYEIDRIKARIPALQSAIERTRKRNQ